MNRVRRAVVIALAAGAVAVGVLLTPTVASADGPVPPRPSCGSNWDNLPCQ